MLRSLYIWRRFWVLGVCYFEDMISFYCGDSVVYLDSFENEVILVSFGFRFIFRRVGGRWGDFEVNLCFRDKRGSRLFV